MNRELERYTNQARFIKMIIDNKLTVSKKKKAVLIAELKKLGFKAYPKVADAEKAGELEAAMEDDDDAEDDVPDASSFDYLLGMAIWSLTQERVDKLLKQIGDKELEIDELIKLSPKDLWTRDLDEFIAEWHKQLEEEKQIAKKFRRMGRRKSDKLGISAKPGKGGKRKKDDDDSEEEFIVSKPKKAAAKPRNNLLTFFSNHATERTTAKPDNDDEDVEMVDAPPPKPTTATAALQARHARAATSKLKSYSMAESDDEDGDDDFDVSHMVKGIGGTSDKHKSLFSASVQRPTSSNGLAASITKPRARPIVDLSDNDETDYTKLVPQGSPMRPAARNANDTILTEDGDEDELISFAALGSKATASKTNGIKPIALKATSALKASAPKPSAAVAKPALAKKVSAAPPKQVKPPAAKPVAKPAAKPAPKKKVVEDDSMINDLLSDEADSPAPVARPSRRAAATKSKYVESEEDSEQSEEDSFEVDDDSD